MNDYFCSYFHMQYLGGGGNLLVLENTIDVTIEMDFSETVLGKELDFS